MPMKLWRYQGALESDISDSHDAAVSTARGPLNVIEQPSSYSTPIKKHSKTEWGSSPTSVVSHSSNAPKEEQSVTSYFRQQETSNIDTLLRVQVDSSLVRTTFYVPVSLMLQREVEMQESAKQTQISEERWSGSRLYSLWKENPQRRTGGEITLRLEPEIVMKDYSDLQWKPWLTACIRSYYNSGNIRIPEECIGSDILLALEYFGILTSSPDTFVFESPHPLGRIKAWSSYFTHRMAMAHWIVSEYKTRLGGNRVWITTPNPNEGDHAETLLQVNGGTAAIFGEPEDGSMTKMNKGIPSCQEIHLLFFENESANKISKETPMKMRRDFCAFLSRLFEPSKATVAFEIERVKITKASGNVSTTLRAVLRLQVEKVHHVKVLDEHILRSSAENPARSEPITPRSAQSTPRSHTTKAESVVNITETQQASTESPLPTNQRSESYGSDSEVVRVTRVQAEGNEAFQYSPYGDSNENDFIEGPLPSIILAVPFDEQRHPNRSTPIPESKRTSPEEYFKLPSETQIPRMETFSELPLFQQKVGSVPVGYINMAYGDLQSVTSALSDPQMDESTIASLSNRLFLEQAQQKPIQKENTNNRAPAIEVPGDPIDHQEDWNKKLVDHSTTTKPNFQPRGAFRPPPKSPEKTVPQIPQHRELNPGGCSFWDSFVANMCEVVYHVPSHSQNSAHSNAGMPMISGDGFHTLHKIPMFEGNPRNPRNSGNVESDFYKRYNQANNWVPAPYLSKASPSHREVMMSDNLGSRMSHESPVMEAAKSMGQSLSNQFDDLVKYAFEVDAPQSNVGSRTMRSHGVVEQKVSQKQQPSTEIAEPLTEKMRGLQREEGQHLSQPRLVQRSGSDERGRKSSDIIATKNRRRLELHSAKSSIIPASNRVEMDLPPREHSAKSSMMPIANNVARMELPPREPRRARVQEQKLTIARKKSTASSYHRSNDLIIGSHTPISEKSHISKAKVRVGSVSPKILQKQESLEY